MNQDHKNEPPLQDSIMEVIRSGKAPMRPRWHFVLISTLYALGAAIIFPFLLYVTSLVIFFMRENGVWFAPVFGMRGWASLFYTLPWLLVGFILVFIVILEILVRRYAFVYSRPILITIAGMLLVIFFGGFLVERTRVHAHMREFAREKRLPSPLQSMYDRPSHFLPRADVYRGVVSEMTKDGFVMTLIDETSTTSVVITPRTRLPYDHEFKVGDAVMVLGDSPTSTVIFAFGIRTVGDSMPY